MVELGGWTGPAECGYPACWRSFGRGCARMLAGHTPDCPKPAEPEPPPDQPGLFNLAKPIDRRH